MQIACSSWKENVREAGARIRSTQETPENLLNHLSRQRI
jgi:hypothetical protein